MRGWGKVAALAIGLAACGGGVRELRGAGGERVYESKCKSSSADCIANALSTCAGGYTLLDSDSHAGGLLADVLPGPVTWYAMVFCCDAAGTSERPEFPFRGAAYVAPSFPAPEPAPASPPPRRVTYGDGNVVQPSVAPIMTSPSPLPITAAPGGCHSDFECGVGNICAKPQNAFEGTCARAVDRNGTPTFSPPRPSSIGPGEGQCMFDTDCPVTFRCIKASSLRGNCMR